MRRACVFALLAAGCAPSADEAKLAGLECVETLEMPKYPPLARQAWVQGPVRLRLMDGDPGWEIREEKTKGLFAPSVERIARTARRKCPAPVEIVFEFRIRQDARPGNQVDEVTLKAPRTILMSTNPAPIQY